MAILEAMAAGMPLVVSYGCNFQVPTEIGCGLVVNWDVSELSDALSGLLALPEERLRRMGAVGREYVREKYSWSGVGYQMEQVYRWVLGGARPSCIEIV
jgi:glycosyltransferase involved in cell wall biosynthesis